MTTLLVASRNRKKLAELHRVLDAAGITGLELLTLDEAEITERSRKLAAEVWQRYEKLS